MELPGVFFGSIGCIVVVTVIFSENPSSLPMYVAGAAAFVRLRRRQNSHVPSAPARATPTTATAIPTFAPVDNDEGEDSDEDQSEARDEAPVGVPIPSLSETRYSSSCAVCDARKENSDSSESREGAKVGIIGVGTDSESAPAVVLGTGIVGFSAKPIESVAKPGTFTTELIASMQRVCQYITACVISRDEQRFDRHGVISAISVSDFGHWHLKSTASMHPVFESPVSKQYSYSATDQQSSYSDFS
ncbi:hypothetical protein SVAN01_03042 [Stagonosporopsis vannaccii]|nr:hypothetical protein SVAN01_03042 [Stagonosporopsis vannaccii]